MLFFSVLVRSSMMLVRRKKPVPAGSLGAYLTSAIEDGHEYFFLGTNKKIMCVTKDIKNLKCILYVLDIHPDLTEVAMIQQVFKRVMRDKRKYKHIRLVVQQDVMTRPLCRALLLLNFYIEPEVKQLDEFRVWIAGKTVHPLLKRIALYIKKNIYYATTGRKSAKKFRSYLNRDFL